MDEAVTAHDNNFVWNLHSEAFVKHRIEATKKLVLQVSIPFLVVGFLVIVFLIVWRAYCASADVEACREGFLGMGLYTFAGWISTFAFALAICAINYAQLRAIRVDTANAGCSRPEDDD